MVVIFVFLLFCLVVFGFWVGLGVLVGLGIGVIEILLIVFGSGFDWSGCVVGFVG